MISILLAIKKNLGEVILISPPNPFHSNTVYFVQGNRRFKHSFVGMSYQVLDEPL